MTEQLKLPLSADGRRGNRCDIYDAASGIVAIGVKADYADQIVVAVNSHAAMREVCKQWDYFRIGILLKEYEIGSITITQLLDDTKAALALSQEAK